MTTRLLWGALAYILPTFPLGYIWHLVLFKGVYESLQIYRPDIIVPFGIDSMIIQGIVWAYLYGRLFAQEPVLRGAWKFACLAFPLAWSFLVLVIAAKQHMTSVSAFLAFETGFTLLQYLVVSPLIALACANRRA